MSLSSESSPLCGAGTKQVTWDAKFGVFTPSLPCTLSLLH